MKNNTKNMPQWLRRTLIIGGSLLALVGIIYGVLVYIRSNSSTVNVVSVKEAMLTYADAAKSETSGTVYADRMQSVYVSATQLVKEVYVSEGDTVKIGDPLMSFDTTLSEIELQRQEIKVGQLELELQKAEDNLKLVNKYHVGGTYDPPQAVYVIPGSLKQGRSYFNEFYYDGEGTAAQPFIYLWDDTCWLDSAFVSGLFARGDALYPGTSSVFVILETRQETCLDAPVTDVKMIEISPSGGSYSIRITDRLPDTYDPKNPDGSSYSEDPFTVSSITELNEMKKDAQDKVDKLEMELKQERLKYDTLAYEIQGGEVLSKVDGVVKTVNDAEEVNGTDTPLLVVSGGGGFYFTGALSETELGSMQVGDIVDAMSWESYQSYEAEITEISPYPSSGDSYHYSEGNNNASLYPFVAKICGDAVLREGEYLQVTYSPQSDEGSGIYLLNMFIRNQNGQSYIFVRGADGNLERRNVSVGRSIWGSYTEVLTGLTADDFIAFPYGKTVQEGAPTHETDMNTIYGY